MAQTVAKILDTQSATELRTNVAKATKRAEGALTKAYKTAATEWINVVLEIKNFALQYGQSNIEEFMSAAYKFNTRAGSDEFNAAARLAFAYEETRPDGKPKWTSKMQQANKYSHIAREVASWKVSDAEAIERLEKVTLTKALEIARAQFTIAWGGTDRSDDGKSGTSSKTDKSKIAQGRERLIKERGDDLTVVAQGDEMSIYVPDDCPAGHAFEAVIYVDKDRKVQFVVPKKRKVKDAKGNEKEEIILADKYLKKFAPKNPKKC